MILKHKIDSLTEDELSILCSFYQHILIDKNALGNEKVPLNRLTWLNEKVVINNLLKQKDKLLPKYHNLIESVIQKIK